MECVQIVYSVWPQSISQNLISQKDTLQGTNLTDYTIYRNPTP